MRILVIKMSSLGDLFHALPAVQHLKKGFNAHIDWVVNDSYVDLVNCFEDVDRVIPFYRNSFFRNFSTFLSDLKTSKYDYVIDLQGLLKSAIVARLARGKKLIGPSFHREGSRFLYHETAGRRNKDRHAVEENMDIVKHLKLKRLEPSFNVSFPTVDFSKFGAEVSGKKVGVLPVSRWHTKNWPVESFAELCALLKKEGVSPILLGGPQDSEVCEKIEKAVDGDLVNLSGKTTLVETAGILKDLDLLVSNDSGPVHMAAAAGTPALVVFGPTDPDRTGPYGEGHMIASAQVPCRPCFSRICSMEGVPCMEGVLPVNVAEIALKMLKK